MVIVQQGHTLGLVTQSCTCGEVYSRIARQCHTLGLVAHSYTCGEVYSRDFTADVSPVVHQGLV